MCEGNQVHDHRMFIAKSRTLEVFLIPTYTIFLKINDLEIWDHISDTKF